jgi:hypothetical protein
VDFEFGSDSETFMDPSDCTSQIGHDAIGGKYARLSARIIRQNNSPENEERSPAG